MPSLDYAWEKLALAVHGIACDSRSLSERLHGAYLKVHTLKADDFPDDLREEILKIDAAFDDVMPSIFGRPIHGVDTMRDQEALT